MAKNNERGRGDERRSRQHSFDRDAKQGNQRESYVVNETKHLLRKRSHKRSLGNEEGVLERSQQKRGHGSSHNRKGVCAREISARAR